MTARRDGLFAVHSVDPNHRIYHSVAQQARNLVHTLQAAPAQEGYRLTALRRRMVTLATALAAHCEAQPASSSASVGAGGQDPAPYRELLARIRAVAVELAGPGAPAHSGLQSALQAFAGALLPETLLALHPQESFSYRAAEHLEELDRLLDSMELPGSTPPDGAPRRFLVLHYPGGEQDNLLLACALLDSLAPPEWIAGSGDDGRYLFGAWILGPAYLFALAEFVRSAPEQSVFRTDCLRRAGGAVQMLYRMQWSAHPLVGPTVRMLCSDCGIVPENGAISETDLQSLTARFRVPPFTPDRFDRDVPPLRDRLRQLLPANDLAEDAVEAGSPADAVSILNAGWACAHYDLDALYAILGSRTAEDRYEALKVLNRLLIKGIELAQIARRWNEARASTVSDTR